MVVRQRQVLQKLYMYQEHYSISVETTLYADVHTQEYVCSEVPTCVCVCVCDLQTTCKTS